MVQGAHHAYRIAYKLTTVFIISAPSGSGKSTLVRRLLGTVSRLLFSVSYTTRAQRELERPGEDYNFISREEFETRALRGEFFEHAQVFGNYYGTHRGALDKAIEARQDLVLDIDVQGARQLKIARISFLINPASTRVRVRSVASKSAFFSSRHRISAT